MTAIVNGVSPKKSLESGFAPRSSSSRATGSFPLLVARANAVLLQSSLYSISTPFSSKSTTLGTSPTITASRNCLLCQSSLSLFHPSLSNREDILIRDFPSPFDGCTFAGLFLQPIVSFDRFKEGWTLGTDILLGSSSVVVGSVIVDAMSLWWMLSLPLSSIPPSEPDSEIATSSS